MILWPHGGNIGQEAPAGGSPIPFQKSDAFQSLGYPDSTADTRGGLGMSGLKKLHEFVQAGGTLITEGSTSAIFPNNYLTPGITVDLGAGLTAPGSIYRGVVADRTSPIAYGLSRNHLPVYYKSNGGPLFSVGGRPGPTQAAPVITTGRGATYQNTSPMGQSQNVFGTWDPTKDWTPAAAPAAAPAPGAGGRGAGGRGAGVGGGRGGGGASAALLDFLQPRVILAFPPAASDMLLSGGVVGGENLEGRPQVIDAPVGQGHVVMFAIRPFWRWQSQGTYILGFNALMHWNDLNAGK